jgi:PhnB protein
MSTVKPIPDGNHNLQAYIVVDDAAKAIELYTRAFGAIELMRMPGPGGKIMHAELQIGDSRLYLCDEFPEMGGKSPKTLGGTPVSLFLWSEDVDAAFQRATAAGCTVKMPLADMFWGDRFGIVEDPFGHSWQMATHKEDLTPEEMMRRGEKAMAAGM